ncbi:hypothetical protein GIB67_034121 [Kingdonia uniflora]|uniref:Uncharacterized protein n=1 Tax=Kingdonia uniflora TaxID=39325 RepID=A0A7J7LCG9_9MAGN|nr:hypothetical protein GIB67_031083 [Kingdonia uniflora]KAF6149130.1 hypothetical protein GIB67_034121 [Kingdonia uniflora]
MFCESTEMGIGAAAFRGDEEEARMSYCRLEEIEESYWKRLVWGAKIDSDSDSALSWLIGAESESGFLTQITNSESE